MVFPKIRTGHASFCTSGTPCKGCNQKYFAGVSVVPAGAPMVSNQPARGYFPHDIDDGGILATEAPSTLDDPPAADEPGQIARSGTRPFGLGGDECRGVPRGFHILRDRIDAGHMAGLDWFTPARAAASCDPTDADGRIHCRSSPLASPIGAATMASLRMACRGTHQPLRARSRLSPDPSGSDARAARGY